MGGGSQDTKSTTVNKPPKWFNDAAIKSLEVADRINKIGYVPYMGNQVAAFTPMQQQAMQGVSDWASAANGTGRVNAMAGMPQAKVDGSGVAGYESGTGFMRNLEQIKERFPKQYEQLTAFGGDLLSDPSKPPSDVKDSPWSVGAAARTANSAMAGAGAGGGGYGGYSMSQLLSEGMKDGPFGAMMAFEGLPYFRRGASTDSTPHGSGSGPGSMTSAYRRLADRAGLMQPRRKKVSAPPQQETPPPNYNKPNKWW